MGTRGLLGFIVDGVRRGSYNYFDSYPWGLGCDVVRFILGLTPEQIDKMAERLRAVKWVDSDETDRITRGEPLPLILNGERTVMPDETDFMDNCLFCEWAYFSVSPTDIGSPQDFENKLVEVWAGGAKITTFPFAKLTEDRMMSVAHDLYATMDEVAPSGDDEGDEEDASEDDDDEDAAYRKGLKDAAGSRRRGFMMVFDNVNVQTVTPATMDAIIADRVSGSGSSGGVTTNDAAATGTATANGGEA